MTRDAVYSDNGSLLRNWMPPFNVAFLDPEEKKQYQTDWVVWKYGPDCKAAAKLYVATLKLKTLPAKTAFGKKFTELFTDIVKREGLWDHVSKDSKVDGVITRVSRWTNGNSLADRFTRGGTMWGDAFCRLYNNRFHPKSNKRDASAISGGDDEAGEGKEDKE